MEKRHPFSYTLGPGPYRFVRLVTIQVGAYGTQVSGKTDDVEFGIGTCAHCHHAIMNCYIIETGDGKKFGVGSDCINKLPSDGQFTNLSDFEKKVRDEKRKKGQESRERQRLKLRDEIVKLVNDNAKFLDTIPFVRAYTRTAWDYCAWYIKTERTLGGYKMFKKKLNMWGIK